MTLPDRQSAGPGEDGRLDAIHPAVYAELRRAARRQMRRERDGHTLQTTALVHEAYIRLAGSGEAPWRDRSHFYGIASRVMRQVLVDHARRRAAAKRGAGAERTGLTGVEAPAARAGNSPEEMLALHEALEGLDAVDPRLRRVVELRFFGGLSEEETARILSVTARTVRRDWVKARAWLYSRIYPDRAD